jgi:hypothetical protein
MTFILSEDGRHDDIIDCYRRYRDYLESKKHIFPSSAYALATSEWWHNFKDHHCPHDGWLETCELRELAEGERGEVRSLTLKLRLLAGFHDGYIELRYPRVFSYALNVEKGEQGHRDWRYDELRVSDNGRVIHEIEWCGGRDTGKWTIEASDVEYLWIPK